jgi:hypothetical protein
VKKDLFSWRFPLLAAAEIVADNSKTWPRLDASRLTSFFRTAAAREMNWTCVTSRKRNGVTGLMLRETCLTLCSTQVA